MVAAGEWSFSKLKLIKSHSLSLMSQDRLNSLAFISIENYISDELALDIMNEFLIMKSHKVNLSN